MMSLGGVGWVVCKRVQSSRFFVRGPGVAKVLAKIRGSRDGIYPRKFALSSEGVADLHPRDSEAPSNSLWGAELAPLPPPPEPCRHHHFLENAPSSQHPCL